MAKQGDARLRHYVYGVHFVEVGGHGPQLVTYVVKESKGPPGSALVTRTYYGTAAGAEEQARDLLETYINGEAHLKAPPPEQHTPEDVREGSVACYLDGVMHFAIVLRVNGATTDAVFLTSSSMWMNGGPDSGEYTRLATKDEIALCGFVRNAKRSTYLRRVTRPTGGFLPTGNEFPSHRLDDLKKEFL